jgi:hypothetical protein
MKAERFTDLDINERASRWLAMASKVVGKGESGRGETSKAWERQNVRTPLGIHARR